MSLPTSSEPSPANAPGPPEGSPAALRERSLWVVALGMAALGTAAYAASAARAVQEAQWLLLGAYTVGYVWLLCVAFVRRLPYALRAGTLLLIVFALGPGAWLGASMGVDGRVFLLAFPVLTSLLFGLWGGLAALAVSLLSLVAVGWLMASGQIPPPPSDATGATSSMSQWIVGTGMFLFAGALVSISLSVLLRGLEATLHRQGTLLKELRQEQGRLATDAADRSGALKRQRVQLDTAAEIARLATEVANPRELLSRAIELIRDRFDFYHASVFLLDGTGLWAELVASTGQAGRQLLERHHRLASGSASIVGWVTANRKTRVAEDVEKDPFHFKNPLLPGTRAEVAAPLLIGDRLVGALDVQSVQPGAFNEADVRAVEAIAAELAIAIENARLLEAARASLEKSSGLTREAWGESWASVVRSRGESAVRLSAAGEEVEGVKIEAGEEAARAARTVLLDDGRQVATPVLVRGEVVATLAARRPAEGKRFEEEDIAVLEAVAGQTAQALEGARQYSEEQRRLAELEVVNRVSQAASQLLNVESLYRVIHTQLLQVLGETDLSVALYDEESNRVSFPYVSEGGDVHKIEPTPLGEGPVAIVIRTRQPLLLAEDVERQVTAMGGQIIGRAPRSWLGVPLLAGESALGALIAQDRETERRFSEDDAALLSTIASQVATAIQNARLLDQVRRAARRQRLIHEITTKVRRSPDMDTILSTAAREVSLGLEAGRAFAALAEQGLTQEGGPSLDSVGGGSRPEERRA